MATKQKKTTDFTELPILPVRDTVLFPNAILPLTVGRESSLKLITELGEEEKFIGVVAQRDPRVDNPAHTHAILLLSGHRLNQRRTSVRRAARKPRFHTEARPSRSRWSRHWPLSSACAKPTAA